MIVTTLSLSEHNNSEELFEKKVVCSQGVMPRLEEHCLVKLETSFENISDDNFLTAS